MFYRITRYYWRHEEDYIYWCPFNTKQEALDDFYSDHDFDGDPVHARVLKVIEAPERPRHSGDEFFTNLFPETRHRNAGDIEYR